MSDEVRQRTEQMLNALQQQGHRVTEPRRAVVEILAEGHQHLSHAEIGERARARCPEIGRATIYRTLELLVELGLVHTTYLGDANQRFVVPTEGHHHHLVCNHCGEVVDLEECYFGNALDTISQQTGFTIDSHLVELYGACATCSQ